MSKMSEYELRRQAKEINLQLWKNRKVGFPAPFSAIKDNIHKKQVVELIELALLAKMGDRKAQQPYKKLVHALIINWQEFDAEFTRIVTIAAQENPAGSWIEMLESNPALGNFLANCLGKKRINIANDAVFKMIRARIAQNEVSNDPVLGTIQDSSIKELYDATTARCNDNITLPKTIWQGTGQRPKSKAEKVAAVNAWDKMPKYERPNLTDWLIENFGTDLATGDLNVKESTFHGWRNLKKS